MFSTNAHGEQFYGSEMSRSQRNNRASGCTAHGAGSCQIEFNRSPIQRCPQLVGCKGVPGTVNAASTRIEERIADGKKCGSRSKTTDTGWDCASGNCVGDTADVASGVTVGTAGNCLNGRCGRYRQRRQILRRRRSRRLCI